MRSSLARRPRSWASVCLTCLRMVCPPAASSAARLSAPFRTAMTRRAPTPPANNGIARSAPRPIMSAVAASAPNASDADFAASDVSVFTSLPVAICRRPEAEVSSPCTPKAPPATLVRAVGSGVNNSPAAPTSSSAPPTNLPTPHKRLRDSALSPVFRRPIQRPIERESIQPASPLQRQARRRLVPDRRLYPDCPVQQIAGDTAFLYRSSRRC